MDLDLDAVQTVLRVFQRVRRERGWKISLWKYSFQAFCCKETTRFPCDLYSSHEEKDLVER